MVRLPGIFTELKDRLAYIAIRDVSRVDAGDILSCSDFIRSSATTHRAGDRPFRLDIGPFQIRPSRNERYSRVLDPANGDPGEGTVDGYGPAGQFGAAGAMLRHIGDDGVPRYFLVRSGRGYSQENWQLPGGARSSLETPIQAAARELAEEAGLSQQYMNRIKLTGQHVFRHPRHDWTYVTYTADVPSRFHPRIDGRETADAGWFTEAEMRKLDLHDSLRDSLPDIMSRHPAPHLAPGEIPDFAASPQFAALNKDAGLPDPTLTDWYPRPFEPQVDSRYDSGTRPDIADTSQADPTGRRHIEFAQILSRKEAHVGIGGYVTSIYQDFNWMMREAADGAMVLEPDELAYISTVDTALSKLPDYEGPVVRLTTLDDGQLSRYQEGSRVKEAAVTSASRSISAIPAGIAESANVEMRMNSLSGKDLSRISIRPYELEVAFRPETEFDITGRFHDSVTGRTVIEMTEVRRSPEP
ncbi:MAG: NUDIX domain-containing protein [Nocardia sp.]|nr:NUDIX domain-containing protein [Nocardia sp.]